MPSIRVLLFARYRDVLGIETLALPAAQTPTAGAVLAHLRSLPGGEALPPNPLIAVNMQRVGVDHALHPDDEVAILPPMAGG